MFSTFCRLILVSFEVYKLTFSTKRIIEIYLLDHILFKILVPFNDATIRLVPRSIHKINSKSHICVLLCPFFFSNLFSARPYTCLDIIFLRSSINIVNRKLYFFQKAINKRWFANTTLPSNHYIEPYLLQTLALIGINFLYTAIRIDLGIQFIVCAIHLCLLNSLIYALFSYFNNQKYLFILLLLFSMVFWPIFWINSPAFLLLTTAWESLLAWSLPFTNVERYIQRGSSFWGPWLFLWSFSTHFLIIFNH